MPEASTILGIAIVAVGMALTPGPNMIYLVSRTLAQGTLAGFVSLCGTALGRPRWAVWQRRVVGGAFVGIGVHLLLDARAPVSAGAAS